MLLLNLTVTEFNNDCESKYGLLTSVVAVVVFNLFNISQMLFCETKIISILQTKDRGFESEIWTV